LEFDLNITNLIKGKDIKLTSARKELLEIFTSSKKPLCYEEIKKDLSMDKATFYRNIIKFEEEQIINSIESYDKKRYFEIKQKPHAHFICTKCNNMECIRSGIDITIKDYTIENIILHGLCANCKLS
jgi:Fur family ferric uptake transcriptional regulator